MFSPALRRAAHILLLASIIFGIGCRFYNLNWDEGAHLHPDERFLTMTVPRLEWPGSAREYFNTNISPLNPFNREVDFFIYGQFPLVLVKAIASQLPGSNNQPNSDNYDDILIVGRFCSALFDTLTLLMLFLIVRRLGGILLGLFAAALLALIPLHVQQAHFFVVDTFATFFLTASFWCLLRSEDANTSGELALRRILKSEKFSLAMAGLCFGIAAACKISSLLFGAVFIIWALWMTQQHKSKRFGFTSLALSSLLFLFFTFAAFRVFNPIAFRGEGGALTWAGLLDVRPAETRFNTHQKQVSFWMSFAEQAAISKGDIDPPWNWQWFGHADYVWPLRNLALWAVGWPILLAGAAGIGLVFRKLSRKQELNIAFAVAALWCLIALGYYGGQYSKFSRYYLVITPFLALLAAWFLLALLRRYRQPWALGLAAVVPLFSLLWCAAVTSIYARPHTRLEATRWIWANVPPGTPVATETAWDDGLPIADTRGIVQRDLDLYNHDTLEKREKMLNTLDEVEWIFISSNRVWGIVPRVPQRWPLASEYYRALFAGDLGFTLEKEFTSYPQLFGFTFPDDNVEEGLTVYDHPHVMLFRKTPEWSREKAALILNEELCRAPDLRPLKDWLHPPQS